MNPEKRTSGEIPATQEPIATVSIRSKEERQMRIFARIGWGSMAAEQEPGR
jgi:hypothetical protein